MAPEFIPLVENLHLDPVFPRKTPKIITNTEKTEMRMMCNQIDSDSQHSFPLFFYICCTLK